jgi:arylsulfatase A-like enzyme
VRILRLGLWFGILTGLGELAFLAARKFIRHKFLFISPDVLWMAPAANAIMFLLAGLLLVLLERAGVRRVGWQTAFGVYLFLAALAATFMYPPLSWIAGLVLALGVGVQGARMAGRHGEGIDRLVRRTVTPLVLLVGLAGLGLHGWYYLSERRSLARMGTARGNTPNVLLIVLDTVRSLSLSLYGYDKPTTPGLAKRARNGVVFTRALSTAPWTFPSHATMFTGRLPHELTASWMTAMDGRYPTLAELLGSRGYVTAGFAANTLYCSRETGLSRGFAHWRDYGISAAEIAHSAALPRALMEAPWFRRVTGNYQLYGRKSAETINREFLGWLGNGKPQPFFAFLNYFDAHGPYLPPRQFAAPFQSHVPENPLRRFTDRPKRGVPDSMILREEHEAYDGTIAYLDAQLDQLFQELERRGDMENTLVIVTSDHGEEFGEHGLMGHGNSLYRPALQVPLVIWRKGAIPAGAMVDAPVSLRDLAATILEEVDGTASQQVPGLSLSRFWAGGDNARVSGGDTLVSEVAYTPRLPEWYPVSKGNLKSVAQAGLRYIRNGDGRAELYDFDNDMLEKRDLAADSSYAERLERFRRMLVQVAGDTGKRRVGAP